MYLITIILILFLLLIIFSPCLNNNISYEFYENHDVKLDQLSDASMAQYSSKISQLATGISSELFTVYEIINRDINWLNKYEELDDSVIFGYNKFNEPIKFVLVYSTVNHKNYLKPEFYRANRWCRQFPDSSMNLCPHKPTPRFDLSDTSRWQYLLDASSIELNKVFEKVYSNDPNYDEMFKAFQWYANERDNYFKSDYVYANSNSLLYDYYLSYVNALDEDTVSFNDPSALAWITSDQYAQTQENTSGIFNFFGGVSLANTNEYPSCSNMNINTADTSAVNNYGANPFGFIFNNTPIVNATPYPFTNPTVGGSCGNLDVNGEKTKVCFFK